MDYLDMFTLLCTTDIPQLHIYRLALAFGSKSGFKNKCQFRASKWGPFTILVCRWCPTNF